MYVESYKDLDYVPKVVNRETITEKFHSKIGRTLSDNISILAVIILFFGIAGLYRTIFPESNDDEAFVISIESLLEEGMLIFIFLHAIFIHVITKEAFREASCGLIHTGKNDPKADVLDDLREQYNKKQEIWKELRIKYYIYSFTIYGYVALYVGIKIFK